MQFTTIERDKGHSFVERGTFVDHIESEEQRRKTTNKNNKNKWEYIPTSNGNEDIINRNTSIFRVHLWINLVLNVILLVLLLL